MARYSQIPYTVCSTSQKDRVPPSRPTHADIFFPGKQNKSESTLALLLPLVTIQLVLCPSMPRISDNWISSQKILCPRCLADYCLKSKHKIDSKKSTAHQVRYMSVMAVFLPSSLCSHTMFKGRAQGSKQQLLLYFLVSQPEIRKLPIRFQLLLMLLIFHQPEVGSMATPSKEKTIFPSSVGDKEGHSFAGI